MSTWLSAHKSAVLDEHCARVGRDPSSIARSVQILVTGSDENPGSTSPGQNLPTYLGPAAARELIGRFIEAGATHVVLAAAPPIPSSHKAQWLAEEVVAPVLAVIAQSAYSCDGRR